MQQNQPHVILVLIAKKQALAPIISQHQNEALALLYTIPHKVMLEYYPIKTVICCWLQHGTCPRYQI